MNKAVFFDRDGTLIAEGNYISKPEQAILIDGVADGLHMLLANGFKIIVVTNQSGVARGYFTVEDMEKVNDCIESQLNSLGVRTDAVYYCPHHPKGIISKYSFVCECRKPAIGMALKAMQDFDLDLKSCYMIGDKPIDVEFGYNFGAKRNFLVRTGYGSEYNADDLAPQTEIVDSVIFAAKRIIEIEISRYISEREKI